MSEDAPPPAPRSDEGQPVERRPVARHPVERPGRPPRTSGGLIGSMIVCLVVIGAFVAFRALTRDNAETAVAAVPYLDTVSEIQGAGLTVAYPPTLPAGWKATSVDFTPGARPDFTLGMLTADGTFVGLRQSGDSRSDLLTIGDDGEATERPSVTVDGSVADTWRAWGYDNGDRAFTAELGDETVLVYGSADEKEQVQLLELLSTDPL